MRGVAGKLVVSLDGVQINVEPNQVLRGSVYPPETRDLCPEAQTLFEMFVSARTLSVADIYGGKLCAALDRQHPRDLYDVRILLADEGLTPQVRRAFVVYLASHDRPMHELLDPKFKDITKTYADEFAARVPSLYVLLSPSSIMLRPIASSRTLSTECGRSHRIAFLRGCRIRRGKGLPNYPRTPLS